jgi:HD superfamily phosphodiesterase
MRPRDNAALMAVQKFNSESMIESRFPGLIADVRKVIQDSENAYEKGDGLSESQLWEHTVHVTSIACRLACTEGIDPLIPSIAALFHDAGKFAGGQYHPNDTIEEEQSAQIAKNLLSRHGMKQADIRKILSGLRALYKEKSRKNTIAEILHDADFLSKFGALGVAAFFTKSVLRGRTLRSSVLGFLSKELTYATCLSMNMRTTAGRQLASKKAADSLKFFRALLTELRDARIADLKMRRVRIPHPAIKDRFLEIRLVVSLVCPKCGKKWRMEWSTEKGVKCTKLTVDWNCSHCSERFETSFCLPEVDSGFQIPDSR